MALYYNISKTLNDISAIKKKLIWSNVRSLLNLSKEYIIKVVIDYGCRKRCDAKMYWMDA